MKMELRDYYGNNIVFIVGSPRSGTTWLQKLLSCHPKIRTGQESNLFDDYIGPQLRAWNRDLDPKKSGRGVIGLGCYFRQKEFLKILKKYMLALLRPMVGDLKEDEIFVEKTPGHAFFIPEIIMLLPRARIIHMLRDGRDVTASLLAVSKSWGRFWAPGEARRAALMWVKHVETVKESSQHLSPKQFYELRYEDLYSSPVKTLQGLFKFLKLKWPEKRIAEAVKINQPSAFKKTKGVKIPLKGEAFRVSGPYVKEPSEFIRKASPGSWENDLSWKEKLLTWHIAAKTMRKFGYKWNFPWI